MLPLVVDEAATTRRKLLKFAVGTGCAGLVTESGSRLRSDRVKESLGVEGAESVKDSWPDVLLLVLLLLGEAALELVLLMLLGCGMGGRFLPGVSGARGLGCGSESTVSMLFVLMALQYRGILLLDGLEASDNATSPDFNELG
jgi:hypothetical protein